MGLSRRYQERLELLRVWARKGKLPPDSEEARELDRLVAAEEAGVDPDEAAAPSPPAGAPLLEMGTRQAQADFYGVSLRCIGKWKKLKAPLGRPADMVAWWGRTFPGLPINQRILIALGKMPPAVVSVPVAVTSTSTSPPASIAIEAPSPPADIVEIPAGDVGFDHAHQRLLREEARLFARFSALEAQGQHAEAAVVRTAWMKLSESLGAADTRQIRNALARGDLIPRALVEKEFASLLRHFPEVLRAGLNSFREELAPTALAGAWEKRAEELLNGLFNALPEKLMAAVAPQAHGEAA